MRRLLRFVLAGLTVVLLVGMMQSPQVSMAETYADQMMHSHTGDSPIATGAIALDPMQPVEGEEITYGTVNGATVRGYLSKPANATEPLPALIVIHEWWGLNDNIKQMTDRLAGEGYTALAVDLFGQVATTSDQARAQVNAALETPEVLQENLRQAYSYLETEQSAPKIASIGWCFGGSWSLNTALLYPDQLDAAVIYYGGQITTDPAQLEPLNMPILGVFGALDTNPPVARVREFEVALRSLDKPVEIHIYEGADHAFANPSGTRYNAEAAEDAWAKTTAFLEQHLQ